MCESFCSGKTDAAACSAAAEAVELSVVTRLLIPIMSGGIGIFKVCSHTPRGGDPVAKRTTDDQIAINIRICKRNGFLSEGKRILRWFDEDGEQVGAISVEAQPSRIVLRYCATESGGKSEQIEDPISLDQTDGGPGWKRPWFLCPSCGRRVAILFQRKYFRCRHCLGLLYQSQKMTRSQRAWMRSREIGG